MINHAPSSTRIDRKEEIIYFSSTQPLQRFPDNLLDHLGKWSTEAPTRTFLAERMPDDSWLRISYEEAQAWVCSTAYYLHTLGFSKGDTILLIDCNSITHGILTLAALKIGIIVAPANPVSKIGRAHV